MGLPVIGIPKYEIELPSSGQKVVFRPFLVKEEKILLLAMEAGDLKAQNRALKEILKNCIFSDIKIESLPMFDIEYLFIQIRGKSVGETLEPVVACPQCAVSGKLKVKLADINVQDAKRTETPYKVMITDKIGVTLVYPSMESMEWISSEKSIKETDPVLMFKIISKCIDTIFDADTVYNPKEYSEKELSDYIESIPSEAFKKIVEFVSDMPRVKKLVPFKCPSCGFEKEFLLQGIEDFFASASPTTA